MKNQNSLLVGITALIINLSGGITAAFAQDIPQRITRNFDVKPGGKLTIDSEIGAIDVQTTDKERIEVVITKEASGKLDSMAQEALNNFEGTFEQNGSDVHIEGKFKRSRYRQYWMEKKRSLRVHFQVRVPYQSNVVLKTASTGAIHVDNLDGTVRAETSIGNLRLGEIQGAVWGKTGGPGSITLKGCQSDVDLESGVGNIELGSITGKAIAKTGGPGKIVLKECQSDVDLESGVGNIELGLVAGKVIAKTGGPGKIALKECQSNVDLESGIGDIELGLVTGKVIAKTGGPGKIVLKDCQDDVNVESGIGDIELVSIAGKVIAKTGGPGKIVLKECQGDVNVESGIGNIHAEIPTQLMHPWILQTSGPGKIEIVLSSSTAVNIDAETRGPISSDIPIQIQGLLTEHKLKGTLNGGGPLLKLRTSLGEIRLKKKSMKDSREKGRR